MIGIKNFSSKAKLILMLKKDYLYLYWVFMLIAYICPCLVHLNPWPVLPQQTEVYYHRRLCLQVSSGDKEAQHHLSSFGTCDEWDLCWMETTIHHQEWQWNTVHFQGVSGIPSQSQGQIDHLQPSPSTIQWLGRSLHRACQDHHQQGIRQATMVSWHTGVHK